LRRARLQDDGAVEILLCGDTNRRNTCQWFFFDVEIETARQLRFRIVTYRKDTSTFGQGQKVVAMHASGNCWQRVGKDYAYIPNRYSIKGKQRLYTLAFTLALQPGRTRLAHFYPYLFGDLLADLRRLRPAGDCLEMRHLNATPQGRPLLMLKITDFASLHHDAGQPRPVIVISARVHPGEAPASFMMRGALQLLLSADEEAVALRSRFTFVIFPMLNPDGVAAGNSRANSDGHDLNRCWETPPKGCEIEAVKKEMQTLCASKAGVLAFLDLHAHSKRHGVFTLSNPGGESLPDELADSFKDLFARRQCTFRCEASKRGSARSTVWRELGVTHTHTVESTYAGTADQSRLVTPEDLVDMGYWLVRSATKMQELNISNEDTKAKKSGATRKSAKKSSGPSFTLVM